MVGMPARRTRGERKSQSRRKVDAGEKLSPLARIVLLGVGLFALLIVSSWIVSQYRDSIIASRSDRFNLVLLSEEGMVSFVSFDSVEEDVEVINFPGSLAIKSRSIGEYEISQLYSLGSYEESAGMFVRKKIQGFMRVPVLGYVVIENDYDSARIALRKGLWRSIWSGSKQSNVSVIDAIRLLRGLELSVWYEDGLSDLLQNAVIYEDGGGYSYNESRLKEYVGGRFFDWGVGEEDVTLAIVNASGVEGLGHDVSEFLANMGVDVVVVEGAEMESENSRVMISSGELRRALVVRVADQLLDIAEVREGKTQEYRADVVLFVGKDMLTIF